MFLLYLYCNCNKSSFNHTKTQSYTDNSKQTKVVITSSIMLCQLYSGSCNWGQGQLETLSQHTIWLSNTGNYYKNYDKTGKCKELAIFDAP